jgi:hypothetical protein
MFDVLNVMVDENNKTIGFTLSDKKNKQFFYARDAYEVARTGQLNGFKAAFEYKSPYLVGTNGKQVADLPKITKNSKEWY